MPSKKKPEVLILLSGGIDSTACIPFYLSQRFSVSALFVDYGQLSAVKESFATLAVSTYYDAPLKKIVCSGFEKLPTGYIPGRNAFLLQNALMACSFKNGIVAIGIHSRVSYADCSKKFIKQMQSLYDLYTDGRIVIGAPFLEWTKKDIWSYCQKMDVPVALTYSCELGRVQPCGQCLSCKDLEAL